MAYHTYIKPFRGIFYLYEVCSAYISSFLVKELEVTQRFLISWHLELTRDRRQMSLAARLVCGTQLFYAAQAANVSAVPLPHRDHKKKNFQWGSRLWVGRRKEPILGYVPKNYERKNSGSNGLSHLYSSDLVLLRLNSCLWRHDNDSASCFIFATLQFQSICRGSWKGAVSFGSFVHIFLEHASGR